MKLHTTKVGGISSNYREGLVSIKLKLHAAEAGGILSFHMAAAARVGLTHQRIEFQFHAELE